jgi:hypothetical protein
LPTRHGRWWWIQNGQPHPLDHGERANRDFLEGDARAQDGSLVDELWV